jgi:hypothetical protein
MFQRENAIGLLLLGLCGFMAGAMIYSIATDTSFEYTGPRWLITVLSILFIAGLFYGLFAGRRHVGGWRGGGRHWPDPMTGRKGWRQSPDKDDEPPKNLGGN